MINKMSRPAYLLAALLIAYFPVLTHAHGRMLVPPSRMSGYLAGLAMPPNYNDHEMNCGGREVQWDQSGGKCGICGEPWPGTKNYERPKGVMVQHQIRTGTYLENEVIRIRLQITVTHRGWHEFRICNVANSGGIEATQACLDRTLLADENGQTRFYNGTTTTGYFDFMLVLPQGLTCDLCVIQWKWKCGNDWGCDSRGCCVGCGERQEEFYACSDVTINSRNIRYTTPRSTARTTTTTPRGTTWRYPTTTTTTRRPTTYPTSRPQWTTYQPSTRPPTTRTTLRTTTTTTTRKPSTTSSYNYNLIYEYLKKNPSNISGGTSIKFPGSGNNNNQPTGRSADDAFLDMVLGRDSVVVVSKDGLSVPVPVVKNSPSSTNDSSTDLLNDYLARDRFCAACQYNCRYDQCYNYCPQVCSF